MEGRPSAPAYKIAGRKIVAVEHPMVIENLDKGIKTFGTNKPFERIINLTDPEECIPLYLRYNDPMCAPLLSFNSTTDNVLLKITVPKRTGRKRKRGSQDPFTDDGVGAGINDVASAGGVTFNEQPLTLSHSHIDHPAKLMNTLKDHAENYTIEAVGGIAHTHRFRGASDFHHSGSNTDFRSRLEETVLTRKVEEMRKFKFKPDMGYDENEPYVPAPRLANLAMPFNWNWHQNPNVIVITDESNGKKRLVNTAAREKTEVEYLSCDVDDIPYSCPLPPSDDPEMLCIVAELKMAMEKRPIWTRRALINNLAASPYVHIIKSAFQYVGYSFRGGPWRDSIIKFGLDPRKEKKCRIYQTCFFKLFDEEEDRSTGRAWHDVRVGYTLTKTSASRIDPTTHIFNGKTLTLDGKVWQLCDVTDPLLMRLIKDSPYAEECDFRTHGWYNNGAWSKIKGIMKTKFMALRTNKPLSDDDFETALSYPDIMTSNSKKGKMVFIPMPDVGLSVDEIMNLKKQGSKNSFSYTTLSRRRKQKMRNERIRSRISQKPFTSRGPKPSKKDKAQRASKTSTTPLEEDQPLTVSTEQSKEISSISGSVDPGTPDEVNQEDLDSGSIDDEEDMTDSDERDTDADGESDDDEEDDDDDSEDETDLELDVIDEVDVIDEEDNERDGEEEGFEGRARGVRFAA